MSEYNEYEEIIISYINFHGDMCAGHLCQDEKLAGELNSINDYGVIMLYGVNQETINAIQHLIKEKIITITNMGETAWFCHSYDNEPVLNLPIAKQIKHKYKEERWMPLVFGKGENFPLIDTRKIKWI